LALRHANACNPGRFGSRAVQNPTILHDGVGPLHTVHNPRRDAALNNEGVGFHFRPLTAAFRFNPGSRK
jgi:hypothetical protein